MRIVFTVEAKTDLDELRSWLQPLNPAALRRVTDRIERCVRMIAERPRIGRPTPRDDIREFIDAQYGFLIPYLARRETLYILRIYRSARSPLDYMTLEAPTSDDSQ